MSASPRKNRSSTKSQQSYNTYSDNDSYSDYSDSFVSDTESTSDKKDTKKSTSTVSGARRGGGGRTLPPRKPAGKKGAAATKNASPRIGDYVTKRMLSARRIKINEMKNEIEELVVQLTEMKQENKMLKRLQFRQEKALEHYTGQENDLPQLLERHSAEVRTLKDQIKKYKMKYEKADKREKDAGVELHRTRNQLNKVKKLAEEKNLGERDQLNRQLAKAEHDLREKDQRIEELEKHLEHTKKNARHELGIEMAKTRDLQKRYNILHDSYAKLELLLKEKDKELDIRNIYSNRAMKPPHRLSSTASSPAPSIVTGRKQKKGSPDGSPRDKAKLYEEKRREEERRKNWENMDVLKEREQLEERLRREREEQERQEEEERIRQEEQERQERSQMEEDRREKALRERMEEERRERERREREEKERENKREKEHDESERRRNEEDRRMREERERVKQEAEERRRREEDERRAREERERESRELEASRMKERELEDRLRREREDRERARQEEDARHAREEANRLANDMKAQDERRRKDLLLAKMQELDNKSGSDAEYSPTTGRRKKYSFTQPIENMHKGKAAYELEELGGYQPSFLGSGNRNKKSTSLFSEEKSDSAKKREKNQLMDTLFGGGASKSEKSSYDDNPFGTNAKPKPVREKRSLPWETDNNKSTDEIFSINSPKNSPLLPRRNRQINVLNAKPAISAVDDLDDDIEEVIL